MFLSSFLSLLFCYKFHFDSGNFFCELAAFSITIKGCSCGSTCRNGAVFTFVIDRRVKTGAIKDSKGEREKQ